MMKQLQNIISIFLCLSILSYAQGNVFNKVRYNGGSISTKVKPDEWDNRLTVNSDAITLLLKDGQSIAIQTKQVTSLSYGQEAHRRVGTAVLIGIFSLGIGALSALHKTKLHYIGVNYNDNDGKKQGVLLQGDKENFRAMLVALSGSTGLPVSVGEKERNEVPVGIAIQTTKEPVEQAAPAAVATGNINVSSTPDGADISVENDFVGNAPSMLKLPIGKHTIRVSLKGYKDWSREITVQAGSEMKLIANLEKVN